MFKIGGGGQCYARKLGFGGFFAGFLWRYVTVALNVCSPCLLVLRHIHM
jgi:hypothetical protein